MERKNLTKSKQNTIYLSEDDARALGIVEGDTQSVYVDGRKVDLFFVDEHEIFDATTEEKRILNNALNLRKRELVEKLGAVDLDADSKNSNYLVPYGTIQDDYPDFDYLQVSKKGKGFASSFKALFGKGLKQGLKGKTAPTKDVLGNYKYKNRTDIFTNEEIEIIQEVISRAQGSRYNSRSNYDAHDDYVATRRFSSAKRKTASSKKADSKKIATAKGHKLSTLNNQKAKRDLSNRPITSPKKKQARRAARRSSNKRK